MKVNTRKFLSETIKLESYLDANYDASGSTFQEKILSVANELPKGIVEKLSYLAGLLERSKAGEKLDKAELKQAGYWIDAVYPYLTNGARPENRLGSRLVWLALAASALYAAYRFLC